AATTVQVCHEISPSAKSPRHAFRARARRRAARFASRPHPGLTLCMRVTKYEHAALRLDESGESVLVAPGSFTTPIDGLSGVVAVVITHEHPDHWTPEHLDRILRAAPGTPIFAPAGVAAAAPDYEITEVSAGDTVTAGRFTLRFFGGDH